MYVNDHPSLTHEAVNRAIADPEVGYPVALMEMAIQAAHVRADNVARQLIRLSQQRAADSYSPRVF